MASYYLLLVYFIVLCRCQCPCVRLLPLPQIKISVNSLRFLDKYPRVVSERLDWGRFNVRHDTNITMALQSAPQQSCKQEQKENLKQRTNTMASITRE